MKNYRKWIKPIAAAATVMLGILFFFGGSDADAHVYEASMIAPDGSRYVLQELSELRRGFKAGVAGIKFRKTDKGEPVWVASSEPEKKKTDRYSLETATGKGFILELPDGTMVWMNAKSTISYPANFSQDTIVLNLEGEAFFELAHSSSHHYLIRSDNKAQGIVMRNEGLIHVGPEFKNKGPKLNISSYGTDSGFQVTWVGGTANIADNKTRQEISLLPGQQANLNWENLTLNTSADTAQIVAWKTGNFIFRNQTIQQIIPELERWYDFDVSYNGRISDKRFNLEVPRSTPLPKVLNILEKQGMYQSMSGRKIIITF